MKGAIEIGCRAWVSWVDALADFCGMDRCGVRSSWYRVKENRMLGVRETSENPIVFVAGRSIENRTVAPRPAQSPSLRRS